MPLGNSSNLAETILTIAFGTCATIIGVVTIHQGRIAWRIWYEHHRRQVDASPGGNPELP